jgi:hypothetical protein
MDKKNVLIPLAIVIVLLVGARIMLNQDSGSPPPESNITRSEAIVGRDAGETPTYTEEDVASRNNRTECWTIINGVVYDITDYIDYHPGGDEILLACGKDGTSLFLERKTEDGEPVGSGGGHSDTAQIMIQEFEIGELAR